MDAFIRPCLSKYHRRLELMDANKGRKVNSEKEGVFWSDGWWEWVWSGPGIETD
jgi:hypothetical protein